MINEAKQQFITNKIEEILEVLDKAENIELEDTESESEVLPYARALGTSQTLAAVARIKLGILADMIKE